MTEATTFAPDDWRSKNDVFTGDVYKRNVALDKVTVDCTFG